MWDWERWDFVQEVLIADGMVLPASGRVPVLDSHNRGRCGDVLGSAGDFAPVTVDGVKAAECTVSFSGEPEGKSAAAKVREGHLTDVSVGYNVLESFWVPENEKQIIAGREFTGPVKVSTKWELRELSLTPIGADRYAKARSGAPQNPKDHKTKTEVSNMNKKMRALLESRGLVATATVDEAWAYFRTMPEADQDTLMRESTERAAEPPAQTAAPATPPAPAAPDADAARAEGQRAERQRVADITEACTMAGMPERAAAFISGGQAIDAVRAEILRAMGQQQQPLQQRIQAGADASEKLRAAAIDGLCLRAGVKIEKPAPGAPDFRGRSLLRFAEECLGLAGVNTRTLTDREIAQRAFSLSTSDLPYVFANVAERVLVNAFAIAPTTWGIWTKRGDAANFKNMDRIKLSEAPDLDLIREGGEYKEADLSDAKETYAVKKYGKILTITWEAIINDDLGALTRIPQLFGNASARKINSVVYAILTANGNMADGYALFEEAHHANLAPTADKGVITTARLGKMRAAMRVQKDMKGLQNLNIAPRYVILPAAQETDMDVILRSIADPSGTNSGVANPFGAGSRTPLIPVVEGLLDATSAKAWYGAADPNQIDTIEVAFLNGQETPYLEEQEGFKVDGRQYKVRIVFGAKAIDHRGLYKNAGE